MRIVLLFLLSSFFFPRLEAQNPGYMGMKFGAGYRLQGIIVPYIFGNKHPSGRFVPVIKNSVHFFYAVRRKILLEMNYSYMNKAIYYDSVSYRNIYFEPVSEEAIGTIYLQDNKVRHYTHFFEFTGKYFIKQFLAPLGPYHQFKAGYFLFGMAGKKSLNVQFAPDRIYNDYGYDLIDGYLTCKQQPFTGWRIGYGVGQQILIMDRVYLDINVWLNFNVGGDITYRELRYNPQSEQEQDPGSFFLSNMVKSIRNYNVLETNLGIGYLLF